MEGDSRNEGIRDDWRADVADFVLRFSGPFPSRAIRSSRFSHQQRPTLCFQIARPWQLYCRILFTLGKTVIKS